MPLAWNEIKLRAIAFSREWSSDCRERAESQTFWNEFFGIFGIRRRTVANFEQPVKNLKGDYEFIDLLWPGKLIAEHKSHGGNLEKASTQAHAYCLNLLNCARHEETPRYILVSDFARIALHDLEERNPREQTIEFPLCDLHKHLRRFAFIAGYEIRKIDPEDPANIKATELLANVHDRLARVGYGGHDLQRFMVRILFCLFADDTGIFQPDSFKLWLQNHTREDGSDLGVQLSFLFGVLDTPEDKRVENLDQDLAAFPYVNGQLFREKLVFPVFDGAMRVALMQCGRFHWEKISPAVFGSLFQSVMESRERRRIGAHYTSERDILKLIGSLFLDDLRGELAAIGRDRTKLQAFHRKLSQLKLLDPACGCGNFLVLAYRELRRLEMDVLQARFGPSPQLGDILSQTRVNVGQFYGIEIEEWPVRIAEVALWLMDHQMNRELFDRFGGMPATIPLKSSPHIRHANALRLDWNDLLPADHCSYVLGNPPFVGAKLQTPEQRADIAGIAADVRNIGLLDYVCGWYFKATQYLRTTEAPAAFVSTNSITQGEQVGVLWNELFRRGVKIHFGHRTFAWESEARGKAHVHVVIIGFGNVDRAKKRIYDYEFGKSEPTVSIVRNISPYLIEGPDSAVTNRSKPLCAVPEIGIGNKPIDDGNYLFTTQEKEEFIAREPASRPWFRRWLGSDEFINGWERWCLWLGDCPAADLRAMPQAIKRVEAVRQFRLLSPSASTRALAKTPTRFHVENMPEHSYLVIPNVSSEKRPYIPMGFLSPRILASNLLGVVAGATHYHLGVLCSAMHMAWVRQVCGRLESRYRYSNKLVYNNFPWPPNPSGEQKRRVEQLSRQVLELRVEFGDGRAGFLPAASSTATTPCSLADLYDPLAMPSKLSKAHANLDRAVDGCYRRGKFAGERQRVEYLFSLYTQLIAPLTAMPGKPKPPR